MSELNEQNCNNLIFFSQAVVPVVAVKFSPEVRGVPVTSAASSTTSAARTITLPAPQVKQMSKKEK